MKRLYVISFGAHLALAVGILAIRGPKIYEDVSVAVFEKAKPDPPKPPPPPPDLPDPPKETVKAKSAAKAPKPADAPPPPEAAAATPSGADIPDLGFAMGNGSGGGLAVNAGPRTAPAPTSSVQVTKKVLSAAPATVADACTETPVKPKVQSLTQPSYTADAREAGISGKVRVELTVDATGHVSSARVLEGLGHGLDEAALASARAATFEPGTRCGKPAITTFVIAMRFAL